MDYNIGRWLDDNVVNTVNTNNSFILALRGNRPGQTSKSLTMQNH